MDPIFISEILTPTFVP